MSGPVRIQRKRIKGWKMPPNTVSVTRPGKWGNPYKVGLGFGTAESAVDAYRRLIATGAYLRQNLHELRGKNLACWCALDSQSCHADVLLKLANAPIAVERDLTK
jgi:hypothetical protein